MRRRVVVTGHVQGVSFRVSTQAEARRRGVSGWVANRPDGAVEAELEGPEDAVTGLVGWLGHGPGPARVDDVRVEDLPERGDTGFSVR